MAETACMMPQRIKVSSKRQITIPVSEAERAHVLEALLVSARFTAIAKGCAFDLFVSL